MSKQVFVLSPSSFSNRSGWLRPALALLLSLSCSSAGQGSGAGGSPGSGGTSASGGRSETGGSSSATGGTSAGGQSGSGNGGAIRTGGSSATGGAPTTGGLTGTGGSAATGGTSASGGTTGTGTSSTTGGRPATGGVTTSGGTAGLAQGGAAGASTGRQDAGTAGVPATGGSTGSAGNGGAGGSAGNDGGTDVAGNPLSPGCGTALSRPDPKKQQTMTIAGTTRYYLLDVPTSADNKTPLMLIFALHGYDMNNVAVVGLYNFTSRSGGKAITVFPQGEGPPPGDTSHWGDNVLKSTWNGNAANYDFIKALKEDLQSRYCINPDRVFITGFSMGGFFTNGLACAHSDWFRAYAPTSGGGPGTCANASAKPAIMIHHGTADTIVEPSSGEGSRDFWTQQNGCSQTTTSSFTGCKTYSNCAEPVVYCVGNWDHTISSTAAANIWSFFSGLP